MMPLEQWALLIEVLDREDLWSKLVAANNQSFVDVMAEEGYMPAETEAVVAMLAKRALRLEMKLPEGGAFDLRRLARQGA